MQGDLAINVKITFNQPYRTVPEYFLNLIRDIFISGLLAESFKCGNCAEMANSLLLRIMELQETNGAPINCAIYYLNDFRADGEILFLADHVVIAINPPENLFTPGVNYENFKKTHPASFVIDSMVRGCHENCVYHISEIPERLANRTAIYVKNHETEIGVYSLLFSQGQIIVVPKQYFSSTECGQYIKSFKIDIKKIGEIDCLNLHKEVPISLYNACKNSDVERVRLLLCKDVIPPDGSHKIYSLLPVRQDSKREEIFTLLLCSSYFHQGLFYAKNGQMNFAEANFLYSYYLDPELFESMLENSKNLKIYDTDIAESLLSLEKAHSLKSP